MRPHGGGGTIMSEQELYIKALDTFGNESQFDMLIEEMAELTQAILKNRRRNSPGTLTENLHEEFVDVRIVMAQIENCLNPNKLDYWKKDKLSRLELRLQKHLNNE